MGDVPINPSGFAHGFRPLDGSDNPPPTPTQRDVTQRDDVVVPGGGFLSAPSQQTPYDAPAGAVGAGLASSKKRRRLPGPLALLQQGHPGGAGQQESGVGCDEDGGQRRSDDSDRDDGGEAGGGHFRKGPWLSLCSATDSPIPEEGASDSRAVQAFLRSAVSPMSEVLSGDFDLRVPVVTAVVDSYTQLSVSDVIVELVDPSGRIKGYLHPGCLEEHGPLLGPGAALLLKEVSIFVSGPGTTRLLNVHPDCILAVFAADTPMPTPARLEWLTTCEPPFAPRSVSDSGDRGFTPPPPSRRTPPPPPTTPAAPNAAGQGGGTGRRRPRPSSSREDPRKHSSQGRSYEHEATPRIPPPAPRSLGLLPRERRERHEERRPGRQEPRWNQQLRQAPATPDGAGSPPQEGGSRNTSSRRTRPGPQPLSPSPPPSPSPDCPSSPGMSSQTQSQRQEQISLGQHSDDEDIGRRGEPEAAPSGTVLSGALVDSIERRETSDGTPEDFNRYGRSGGGAPMTVEGGRGRSRGGVDTEGFCATTKEGGGGDGVAAGPSSTSTQQQVCARALGGGTVDDEGDGCGDSEDEEIGGGAGTRVQSTHLGDKCITNGVALQGDAAGPSEAAQTTPSLGDVAGGAAQSGATSQSSPSCDADQPITTGTASGVGEKKGLDGGGAPAATPSSIWADLDGLASGDDSTSDDGQVPARSHLTVSESTKVLSMLSMPSVPQGPASSNTVVLNRAADKTDASATTVAGDTASDGAQRGKAQSVSAGGVLLDAGRAPRGPVAPGGVGFSLLAGAGADLGDNELLDAALEDSE